MTAFQRHIPAERARSPSRLVHEMSIDITRDIILGAGTAIADDMENENRKLFGWGSKIEMFDAFIAIYNLDDSDYQRKRLEIEDSIKKISVYDIRQKMAMFRLYKKWFALIATKLARFKIFPPLPVSYAEGLGEIREIGEDDIQTQ